MPSSAALLSLTTIALSSLVRAGKFTLAQNYSGDTL